MAKKVVVFLGSPRKGETFSALKVFESKLRERVKDLEFEIVHLRAFRVESCRGCFLCLTKGEELCPHKDDFTSLVRKMNEADGVVFATPNYSLQVTGTLKIFLDRCAHIFHRPRYFDKVFMAIVTQGVIGAGDIVKYLETVARYWGFRVVKGVGLTTLTPRTAAEDLRIEKRLASVADRFHRALTHSAQRKPSWFMLAIFRLSRSSHAAVPNEESCDYRYFRDKGWFESEYYYPVRLSVFRRWFGAALDRFATKQALKRHAALPRGTPPLHFPPQFDDERGL